MMVGVARYADQAPPPGAMQRSKSCDIHNQAIEPLFPPNLVDNQDNRYDLVKFLGKGGFGNVYLVDNTTTKQYAALKVIQKIYFTKPHHRDKLNSQMNHVNIVKCFASFEDVQNMYLVLEFCEHDSLMILMKERHTITEPEARVYLRQVCRAIHYMIDKERVLHCDIKLGNIYLSANMVVKIGDFGLAITMDDALARKRGMCGTPNYLAPELLNNESPSPASECWSVGCLLYAMLCGKPPFEAEGVVQTYDRVKAGRYSIPPHVSDSARILIQQMLLHEACLRPSMHDILCSEFCQDSLIVWPLTNEHLRRPPHQGEFRNCVSSVHQLVPPPMHRSMPNVTAAIPARGGMMLTQQQATNSNYFPPSTPMDERFCPSDLPQPQQQPQNRLPSTNHRSMEQRINDVYQSHQGTNNYNRGRTQSNAVYANNPQQQQNNNKVYNKNGSSRNQLRIQSAMYNSRTSLNSMPALLQYATSPTPASVVYSPQGPPSSVVSHSPTTGNVAAKPSSSAATGRSKSKSRINTFINAAFSPNTSKSERSVTDRMRDMFTFKSSKSSSAANQQQQQPLDRRVSSPPTTTSSTENPTSSTDIGQKRLRTPSVVSANTLASNGKWSLVSQSNRTPSADSGLGLTADHGADHAAAALAHSSLNYAAPPPSVIMPDRVDYEHALWLVNAVNELYRVIVEDAMSASGMLSSSIQPPQGTVDVGVWIQRWLVLPGVCFTAQYNNASETSRFEDGTVVTCVPFPTTAAAVPDNSTIPICCGGRLAAGNQQRSSNDVRLLLNTAVMNSSSAASNRGCIIYMTSHVTGYNKLVCNDWSMRYSHAVWPEPMRAYADYMYMTVTRMTSVLASAGFTSNQPYQNNTSIPPSMGGVDVQCRNVVYHCRAPIVVLDEPSSMCQVDYTRSTVCGSRKLMTEQMSLLTVGVGPLHTQVNTEWSNNSQHAKVKMAVAKVGDSGILLTVIVDRQPAAVFRLLVSNAPDDRQALIAYAQTCKVLLPTLRLLFDWLKHDVDVGQGVLRGAEDNAQFAEALHAHFPSDDILPPVQHKSTIFNSNSNMMQLSNDQQQLLPRRSRETDIF